MPPSPHALNYYKDPAIQQAILEESAGREVGIRYGTSFGKRPDVLLNPRDVWEAVKQGATSFHITEERWHNPLDLETGLSPREMDELRAGWDLVFDIDCPYWEYSRLITHILIKVLQDEGIRTMGVKFSGNKGFHVLVPFESFPTTYRGKSVRELFPDGARRVMAYVLSKVSERFREKTNEDVLSKTGLSLDALKLNQCNNCGYRVAFSATSTVEFLCEKCGRRSEADSSVGFMQCEHCNKLMRLMGKVRSLACQKCRGTTFSIVHDVTAIIKLDEGLASSRHMFRAPYSMHEKSGLISLPLRPDEVLLFDRESASPEKRVGVRPFLPRTATEGEATSLFEHAMDFNVPTEEVQEAQRQDFESVTVALAEEHFPPCIKHILHGMKDGKKRACFALIAFLSSVGWEWPAIEKRLGEWNEKNNPPLRRGFMESQLRQFRARGKALMPPNCDNKAYFVDMGVCTPDGLCSRIRNPANYAILRARDGVKNEKKPKVQAQ